MKNNFWIYGGLLLLMAALYFTICNFIEEKEAGEKVEDVIRKYDDIINNGDEELIELDDTNVPAIKIDGNLYIGILEIPSLSITLPIINEYNDDLLKVAPCRFKGQLSSNDLIIAGHNYKEHFGKLYKLKVNDIVIFTDNNGNRYEYRVTEIEHIEGHKTSNMLSGDWDLTLFTCTTDSQSRVTVRCKKK